MLQLLGSAPNSILVAVMEYVMLQMQADVAGGIGDVEVQLGGRCDLGAGGRLAADVRASGVSIVCIHTVQ